MKIKEILYLYNLTSRVEVYDKYLKVVYQGDCKYLLTLKEFNKVRVKGIDCVGNSLRLFIFEEVIK